MNEKIEQFENDLRNSNSRVETVPPAGMFLGTMVCFLCGTETVGLPVFSSGWRCIQIEGEAKYFICKKCSPSVVASVTTWQDFYRRTIRKIYEKDYNRPLKELVIFIDAKRVETVIEEGKIKTPSGNAFGKNQNVSFTSIPAMLFDIYEQTLPTIMAAVEQIAPSNGTQEFTATADLEIKEVDWKASLKFDFQSFGGVRMEHLPEKEKKKAAGFYPLYLTLETLAKNAVGIAVGEMERQEKEGVFIPFNVSNDNLTFIEGYLYKIVIIYEFQYKTPETVFVAPENPNLN